MMLDYLLDLRDAPVRPGLSLSWFQGLLYSQSLCNGAASVG